MDSTEHRRKGPPPEPPIEAVNVSAYVVPTDAPEADGTFQWDKTTLVLVEVTAGGRQGLGFTYADTATARLIQDKLAPEILGRGAMAIPKAWAAMRHCIRNLGRPGICSMAISAVDAALWDLKAKLCELPLLRLWGTAREAIPVYGSGGFTSYSLGQLQNQLAGWVNQGISRVKMKIGQSPCNDFARVKAAREAIGPDAELFVDANGAYTRKQALKMAERFAVLNVHWFEEPVSSDDLEGLRLLRDRGPADMAIAAGEYGYDLPYFLRMLEAQAVDVLQVDGTRCGGFSEFFRVAGLCAAKSLPLSAHTAPTLHAHICCAVQPAIHVEYFHDHARIEQMLFEGALTAQNGMLVPDLSRPGLGIEFKRQDAAHFAV